ncbi:hypothetical protein BpHYR1_024411 [Brachionus plicatilis]|uniref:Uncharacterized protein n=1 Tax=Brachionus plicatilis TaxID=10195 RepID=A0A3M7QWI2_BRAPC|nr:hypothetical protein BpHYR1_024411 [Brachionus plicatilis]
MHLKQKQFKTFLIKEFGEPLEQPWCLVVLNFIKKFRPYSRPKNHLITLNDLIFQFLFSISK